jgi:drug/metabolite transporter (DMT)-like permease
MLWASLITIHMAGLVGYTILLRKSSFGNADKTFTATMMATGIWLPSLLLLTTGKVNFNLTLHQWIFLILGGFFVAGLMVSNVWALSHLDASMFTILYNLRLFMTTILGFFILNELPTLLQMFGGVIILLSIFMLNLHVDSRWKSKPILIGLFTMLWFSVHAVVEKYNLGKVDIYTYLFIFFTIGATFLWILMAIKKVNIKSQLIHFKDKYFLLLLITRTISAYAYVFALKYGSLAVSNYISGMSVVFIVLFGIYFLGERDEMKQKFAATAIALVGMTLIMVSKVMAG